MDSVDGKWTWRGSLGDFGRWSLTSDNLSELVLQWIEQEQHRLWQLISKKHAIAVISSWAVLRCLHNAEDSKGRSWPCSRHAAKSLLTCVVSHYVLWTGMFFHRVTELPWGESHRCNPWALAFCSRIPRSFVILSISSLLWCLTLWLPLPPQTILMRGGGWKHSNTWRSWRLHMMTIDEVGLFWSFAYNVLWDKIHAWRRCQCLEVDGGLLCGVPSSTKFEQKEMGDDRSIV